MNIKDIYKLFLKYPKITTDTRKTIPNSIFFALKGDNFNGNKFAKQALQNGASIAIIDDNHYKENDNYIVVEDVLTTLQNLAKTHREKLTIPIIGITGSNGKTTTKELIKSTLSQNFNCFATQGNLNNHIGVPLSILSINKTHEVAIIEMGANHQKEIEFLCTISQPNYGLITNIGKAHLEGFGGFEGVKKGKKELYTYLINNNKKAFINTDDALLNKYINKIESITYGSDSTSYCKGKLLKSTPTVQIGYEFNNNSEQTITSNLIGSYNFNNILAAITIGLHFKLTAKQIKNGIENYIPTNNRSQLIKTKYNKIILDAYNANPTSMKLAIENFSKVKGNNKLAILGDMLELGDESKTEHQKIVTKLKSLNLNTILVGKEFKETNQTIFLHFNTTNEAKKHLQKLPLKNAYILIKGSRGIKLEELVETIS